jgi:hypothetical protein
LPRVQKLALADLRGAFGTLKQSARHIVIK